MLLKSVFEPSAPLFSHGGYVPRATDEEAIKVAKRAARILY